MNFFSESEIDKIFKLAFGKDAKISKGYTTEEILNALTDIVEKSHAFEVMQTALQEETSFDINKGVSN